VQNDTGSGLTFGVYYLFCIFMKNHFLLGFACLALLAACKKDSDPATETSAKAAALVNKNWKLTAATAQQGAISQDVYAGLKPCEKDNYIRFKDDHTMEGNEGTSKCSTSDSQTYSGNWALINNDGQLVVSTPILGSGAAVPDVLELTPTRMVLRGTVNDSNITTVITATFTAD
jgi:hypothetical protein